MSDGSPRCLHYTMAHIALREIGLTEPLKLLGLLMSEQRNEVLANIMKQSKAACADTTDPGFGTVGLRLHPCRVDNQPCMVFEFPPPENVPEAHFTALVAELDADEGVPEGTTEADISARYFTLEYAQPAEDGSPQTVLGEWTNGQHCNYGDGPAATMEDFIGAFGPLMHSEEGEGESEP